MKEAYPTFIAEDGEDFLVYVPDFEIYTFGKSMADAIYMARDAIGLAGTCFEDDKRELPTPSSFEEATKKAKADTEIFDYTTGILTLVDIDFVEYRKENDNRSVRRNVTLPNWLNSAAIRAGINVSRILQEALMEKIGGGLKE